MYITRRSWSSQVKAWMSINSISRATPTYNLEGSGRESWEDTFLYILEDWDRGGSGDPSSDAVGGWWLVAGARIRQPCRWRQPQMASAAEPQDNMGGMTSWVDHCGSALWRMIRRRSHLHLQLPRLPHLQHLHIQWQAVQSNSTRLIGSLKELGGRWMTWVATEAFDSAIPLAHGAHPQHF